MGLIVGPRGHGNANFCPPVFSLKTFHNRWLRTARDCQSVESGLKDLTSDWNLGLLRNNTRAILRKWST